MPDLNLKITHSHVRFDWLKALGLPRQVPDQAVKQIMGLKSPAEARELILRSGHMSGVRVGEQTGPVYLADIFHPGLGLRYPPATLPDGRPPSRPPKPKPFSMKVFLTQEISQNVAPASAVVKYDMPETQEMEEGERYFRRFQAIVSGLCQNVFKAAPFAGLIGYNTEDIDRISLSLRGISLFFSSNPADMYPKIEKLISLEIRLEAEKKRDSQKTYPSHYDRMAEISSELEQARCTPLTGENISLLSAVTPYASDNILVDLR